MIWKVHNFPQIQYCSIFPIYARQVNGCRAKRTLRYIRLRLRLIPSSPAKICCCAYRTSGLNIDPVFHKYVCKYLWQQCLLPVMKTPVNLDGTAAQQLWMLSCKIYSGSGLGIPTVLGLRSSAQTQLSPGSYISYNGSGAKTRHVHGLMRPVKQQLKRDIWSYCSG